MPLFLVQNLVHCSGHVVIDFPLFFGQIQQVVVQQRIEKGRSVLQGNVQIPVKLLILTHRHYTLVFLEQLNPLIYIVILYLPGLFVKHLYEQRNEEILVDVVVFPVHRLQFNQLRKRFVTLRFGLFLQVLQKHIFRALSDQGNTLGVPHVVQIFQRVGIGVFVKLDFKLLHQGRFLILLLLAPAVMNVVETDKIGGLTEPVFLRCLLGDVLVLLKDEIGEVRPEPKGEIRGLQKRPDSPARFGHHRGDHIPQSVLVAPQRRMQPVGNVTGVVSALQIDPQLVDSQFHQLPFHQIRGNQ